MSKTFTSVLVVWGLLVLSAPAWAADDTKHRWDDVKASLKQGAYREALESLDVILSVTPNDPWAQLYHSLCELRLKAPMPFPQLSRQQLASLSTQLHQEERAQRRAASVQKVLERQVRKEQKQWDRELALLQRQAERDQQVQRATVQAQAVAHARAESAQQRALAQQEALQQAGSPSTTVAPAGALEHAEGRAEETPAAPAGPQVSTTEETATTPAPASGRPTERSIELSPVVVPISPTTPPIEKQATPSLAGRSAPPKGAVQINADQMSVSPDRRVALAQGNVEVVFENALLTCDHLTLFTDTKDAYAEGHVRLEQGDQVFRGEMGHYNFETKKGRFLQGSVSSPPWHEYGRSVEHIAEGVYEVTPGYLTSCELEPPHFKFYGRRATVFSDDKSARAQNVTLFVEKMPFLYFPYLSFANRQSPFFIIPGKRKPWGPFALAGYRYELPPLPGGGEQKGTLHVDWRRFFLWGFGFDHQIESQQFGKALLKVYYNEEQDLNVLNPKATLPKGAAQNRYRVLWRHRWNPLPDTTVVTDIQKYSDPNFRQDLLFREEFTKDDQPESFISLVKNDPNFTVSGLVRKRVNRFQTVDNALPQLTFDVRPQQISDTNFFSETKFDVANLETKRANSDNDTDVVRVDWFQQLKYALGLFRPVEVTPRAGVRQTFYTKDIQGSDREGQRDLFSGQFSSGVDTSLKLFRIFPVVTNALGLNINQLRHVLTPSVSYNYVHRPTVPNELLNFAAASGPTDQLSFGIENKLQTRRPIGSEKNKLRSVDLVRFLISVPYTFRGSGNKSGGRLGDWGFDLETYPWPWLRLESDWKYANHLVDGSLQNDGNIPTWNLDLVMVGGQGTPQAQYAPGIQAPAPLVFQPGPRGGIEMIPRGQWFLGLGHRYSQNDKTESVLQYERRLSDKWQIGTFHRYTWKEVAGGAKRFNNLREYQYTLRRDLHDWIAELVYRVDREFGEEIFFTLTLKAYPQMPIQTSDSYHQPKFGSQSSPFSPIRVQ